MGNQSFLQVQQLEKRFGGTARWVLSVISLVAYVLTKIAVGIFAGMLIWWYGGFIKKLAAKQKQAA